MYEGVEEFQKAVPDIEHKQWAREESPAMIETGDWVEALDGYITKCLNSYPMTNKKGITSTFFRFPNGTFVTYLRKTKTFYWQKWYAQFTTDNQERASVGYKYKETEDFSNRKMQFARLVSIGVAPYIAYGQVKLPFIRSMSVMKNKIRTLLMDREVTTEIARSITPYIDKLKQDPDFSDDNMVEYIKEFMINVRKGSQTHLNSIMPLLTLLDKVPAYMQAKPNKKDNIIDAKWNVAPPEGET